MTINPRTTGMDAKRNTCWYSRSCRALGIDGEYRQQNKRRDRAENGAHVVGRPVKAKYETALIFGNAVCDQGVTRSSADAFADAVCHPHHEHLRPTSYEGEERTGYGSQ
jgi:hypothetical protein